MHRFSSLAVLIVAGLAVAWTQTIETQSAPSAQGQGGGRGRGQSDGPKGWRARRRAPSLRSIPRRRPGSRRARSGFRRCPRWSRSRRRPAGSRAGPDTPPMPLTLLRLPRTNITRAKFPAIDFHVHASELTTAAAYKSFIALMDSIGMGAVVNLNGGTGTNLDTALKAGEPYRDRVATFITFSAEGINEPGWSQKFAAEMERGLQGGRRSA